MDISNLVTVTKIKRVLWFVVRNPFLILKRAFRWALVLLFWLFVLGWGISAFALEQVPSTKKYLPIAPSPVGQCGYYLNSSITTRSTNQDINGCYSNVKGYLVNFTINAQFAYYSTSNGLVEFRANVIQKGGSTVLGYIFYRSTAYSLQYFCPPDNNPLFSVGPVVVGGVTYCQKPPIVCKMGEVKTVSQSTGVETCQENCKSVAGQGMTGAAYNQAFLPSATVTCYGSCSVISQGTTVVLPANGFTMHGDIQFTGDKCPVTFPDTGDGQPVYNDQPESSDETNAAQDQLQNAASNATSTDNAISGATGTADLNQVVDKIAEASNAQIKAMSEQNAAMGKVIEGVGKDIQGAIKQSGGGGSGTSMGQLATANAIKEGNATLQEISDKLDEQQNPEPPVKPGTDLAADASGIHEANDWGQRNFGTVLTANAERFKALPVFSLPSTFFNANIAGGSCPSYTGSFTLFGTSFDVSFDAFCSQTVMSVMPYIRAVVMMLFGWLAWRIAIGNGG